MQLARNGFASLARQKRSRQLLRVSIVNRYKRNNRYMAEERHNRLPNKLIEPIPWGLPAILTSSPGGLEHPTHFRWHVYECETTSHQVDRSRLSPTFVPGTRG